MVKIVMILIVCFIMSCESDADQCEVESEELICCDCGCYSDYNYNTLKMHTSDYGVSCFYQCPEFCHESGRRESVRADKVSCR